MRNKSPLALMEQVLMVSVFALAAALCLQGFVLSNRISTSMETRNKAVTLAQNAAEIVKYYSGDLSEVAQQINGHWDGNVLRTDYVPAGHLTPTHSKTLCLEISPSDSSTPFLGTAIIRVLQDEEILFEITVAWQEEPENEEK